MTDSNDIIFWHTSMSIDCLFANLCDSYCYLLIRVTGYWWIIITGYHSLTTQSQAWWLVFTLWRLSHSLTLIDSQLFGNHIQLMTYMGVSINGGTPNVILHGHWIFPKKTIHRTGVPPWRAGTPHIIRSLRDKQVAGQSHWVVSSSVKPTIMSRLTLQGGAPPDMFVCL